MDAFIEMKTLACGRLQHGANFTSLNSTRCELHITQNDIQDLVRTFVDWSSALRTTQLGKFHETRWQPSLFALWSSFTPFSQNDSVLLTQHWINSGQFLPHRSASESEAPTRAFKLWITMNQIRYSYICHSYSDNHTDPAKVQILQPRKNWSVPNASLKAKIFVGSIVHISSITWRASIILD